MEKQSNPHGIMHIMILLRQLFGDKIELALDYIQLMIQQPEQKLPAILLESKTPTGKTMFINLLKKMFPYSDFFDFEENVSRHELGLFKDKSIILIFDEGIIKKETYERIKQILTTNKIRVEELGSPTEYYAHCLKPIICTNRIGKEGEAIRHFSWTVYPLAIKPGDYILDLELFIYYEIPDFIQFIESRTLSTVKKSSLWFDRELFAQPERQESKYMKFLYWIFGIPK